MGKDAPRDDVDFNPRPRTAAGVAYSSLSAGSSLRWAMLRCVDAAAALALDTLSDYEKREALCDVYEEIVARSYCPAGLPCGFGSTGELYWHLWRQRRLETAALRGAPVDDAVGDDPVPAQERRRRIAMLRNLPPPRDNVETFDRDVRAIMESGAASNFDDATRILCRYGKPNPFGPPAGPHLDVAREWREETGRDIEAVYRQAIVGNGLDGHTGQVGRPRELRFEASARAIADVVAETGATGKARRLTALPLVYFIRPWEKHDPRWRWWHSTDVLRDGRVRLPAQVENKVKNALAAERKRSKDLPQRGRARGRSE